MNPNNANQEYGLIIIGGAPSAMEDLRKMKSAAVSRCDLMLVGQGNAETRIIPRLAYHVSHENDFERIREARNAAKVNTNYATASNNPWPGMTYVFPDMTGPTCPSDCRPRRPGNDIQALHYFSGSSAMLALKVGLRFGYRKIILAGVSLETDRYAAFQKGWTWISDLLKCCPARALSGFPAAILGEYSEEWFHDQATVREIIRSNYA
jgi:hypothetical protein